MDETRGHRWFHLTPDRLICLLLAVEGLLWLSERFQWPCFIAHKGWPPLMAIASVGAFLLFMLLRIVAGLLFGRRFQFSLRLLLALVFAVAFPFSWLAVAMKKAKEQADAVQGLIGRPYSVGYDYDYDANGYRIAGASAPGPAWLRTIFGDDFFRAVVFLSFSEPAIDSRAEPSVPSGCFGNERHRKWREEAPGSSARLQDKAKRRMTTDWSSTIEIGIRRLLAAMAVGYT